MGRRVQCPHCGQWPTTRADGRLAKHHYRWPHPRAGHICLGSRTNPNQTTLTPTEQEPR